MAVKQGERIKKLTFNRVYQGDTRELVGKLPNKSIAVTLS
jgi:hypothetical protein